MFNTDFPIRFATPTELLALRTRMTSLARVGAPAAELAQAALEYYYYVHLNATHALKTSPKPHLGEPRIRVLSPVESLRALHAVQTNMGQDLTFTHAHNAHIPQSHSLLAHYSRSQ